MSYSPDESRAREEVLRAALSVLQAELLPADDPHGGDSLVYAHENLALAARDLTRAVDALPAHEKPVHWTSDPHSRYRPPGSPFPL